MNNEKEYPSIKDLADKKVPHGKLIVLDYNARSSGMMYNSDTATARPLWS